MSDMSINQVLAQMRVLAAQAQQGVQAPRAADESGAAAGPDFSTLLKRSIDAVNEVQQTSGDLKKRFELGDPSVSMVDIAIASEKSKVAFTAMTQVRNKLVQAYKDVMNMPI